MLRVRLWFFRKKRAIRDFHRNPAPHWLNTWAQIASVILAAIAIWLTIMYAQRKTQIENMEKVIEQLAQQSASMDTVIQQLASQNYTLRVNAEPKFTIVFPVTIRKLSDTSLELKMTFLNVGGRIADNVADELECYYIDALSQSKVDGEKNFISPQSVPPGTSYFANKNLISKIPITNKLFDNLFFKVRVDFTDRLTNQPLSPFLGYFKLAVDKRLNATSMALSNSEKATVEKLETGN